MHPDRRQIIIQYWPTFHSNTHIPPKDGRVGVEADKTPALLCSICQDKPPPPTPLPRRPSEVNIVNVFLLSSNLHFPCLFIRFRFHDQTTRNRRQRRLLKRNARPVHSCLLQFRRTKHQRQQTTTTSLSSPFRWLTRTTEHAGGIPNGGLIRLRVAPRQQN